MIQNEENLDFYMKETTQKLIDSQYMRTKAILTKLFLLYLLCYCLPFVAILFTGDDTGHGIYLHNVLGHLCLWT